MPVTILRVNDRKVLLAVELGYKLVNCARVIVFSAFVLVKVARIDPKANSSFAVCQVSNVAHDEVDQVCWL